LTSVWERSPARELAVVRRLESSLAPDLLEPLTPTVSHVFHVSGFEERLVTPARAFETHTREDIDEKNDEVLAYAIRSTLDRRAGVRETFVDSPSLYLVRVAIRRRALDGGEDLRMRVEYVRLTQPNY
jgi:hypothetical protein